MKKLLLAVLLAAGGMIQMTAQEIYFMNQDGDNLNGTTYVFEDVEIYPYSPDKTGILIDPKLYIYSDTDIKVNIQAKANVNVNLCAGGQCESGLQPIKENVELKAGQALSLNFDYDVNVTNEEYESTYQIPAIEAVLSAWPVADPSAVVSVTVKMGDVGAGVESIAMNQNSVIFNGNSLNYDVTGASQLSVYSLSGKTVLNKAVAGNGSLSLDGLSKGIYLYRLTNKNGQAVKSAKIIIK